MKTLAFVFLVLTMAGAANGDTAYTLGHSDDTVMVPAQGDDCSEGVLFHNHDGSAENGYAWSGAGTVPPYYGAFAEAYDLGGGTVVCGAYWLSQIGYFSGEPMDCYVWEGGVTTEPGDVLCMIPGVVPGNVPLWPDCGQNDVEIGCCVSGEFTVGYWADFSDQAPQFYICVDEDGPGGYPWTCVAPDIGYPTGWQHPGMVWGDMTISMCIGAYFGDDPSPAESRTWGSVKALFE
jgi:hypothetical protein